MKTSLKTLKHDMNVYFCQEEKNTHCLPQSFPWRVVGGQEGVVGGGGDGKGDAELYLDHLRPDGCTEVGPEYSPVTAFTSADARHGFRGVDLLKGKLVSLRT